MAGDTVITVIGNLTADVELKFTPAGIAVANFTVASTPRYFDRNTNQWKDSEALFLRCSLWREAAENAAESLTRGARVLVSGRLKQRSYQTREGEKRTVVELEVDEVGPSLRYATAKVTKRKPNHTNTNDSSDRSRELVGAATGNRSGDDDPWATTGSGFGGGFGGGEEPSF
ncbi:single-stranded DNA-binding protein [Nocardia gipuzkoensis]